VNRYQERKGHKIGWKKGVRLNDIASDKERGGRDTAQRISDHNRNQREIKLRKGIIPCQDRLATQPLEERPRNGRVKPHGVQRNAAN